MKTKSRFLFSLVLICGSFILFNFTEKKDLRTGEIPLVHSHEEDAFCAQVATYSVKLRTVGGAAINPNAVAPNTAYRIHITYSGTYTCCSNGAYCVVLAYGFNVTCVDAINGSAIMNITTNASLPPFGIIGVVGPTDCSGSVASATASTSTQKEVI